MTNKCIDIILTYIHKMYGMITKMLDKILKKDVT